jgi:manganese/iron transport system substrate-binding protein
MTSTIKFPASLKPLFGLSKASLGLVALTLSLASCTTSQQATNQSPAASPTANSASPNNSPSPTANLPKVVVTHSVLCDITKEVAQATIDLQCLIAAGADPHEYQAKPEDKRAIEQAKLILYGGYNFEPGLIKMIQSTQTPAPKIAVSEVAVPKPLKEDDDHDHDHSKDQTTKPGEKAKDHDHGEFDPHVWHNAQNGAQMVQVVRDQLKTLSPENAKLYTTNAEKLTKNLQDIDTWIKAQVQTYP